MRTYVIAGFDVVDCGKMIFDEAVKQAAIANDKKIGACNDWVLPDLQTLRALAILAPSNLLCWSSSPDVVNSSYAWFVDFYDSDVGYGNHDGNVQVRLVRASQCLAINAAGALKSMQDAGIVVKE